MKYPEVPFVRYSHTSKNIEFASVPNLLLSIVTKFNLVRGTYLLDPPPIFVDGDGDAAGDGLVGATARFLMPMVDPMI